jgi:hypothetical protein
MPGSKINEANYGHSIVKCRLQRSAEEVRVCRYPLRLARLVVLKFNAGIDNYSLDNHRKKITHGKICRYF